MSSRHVCYTHPPGSAAARDDVTRLSVSPAGFCLCCGTTDVAIFHPLFEGSLCSKCKVRNYICGQRPIPPSRPQRRLSPCRITSRRRCTGTTRTGISPTAPSAATGWRSSCAATAAAAGRSDLPATIRAPLPPTSQQSTHIRR